MASFKIHVFFLVVLWVNKILGYVTIPVAPVGTSPPLPPGGPQPPPKYMVNNINNIHGVAPDKGVLKGPVLGAINASLYELIHHRPLDTAAKNMNTKSGKTSHTSQLQANSGYWLETAGSAGQMPLAPSGYQFFRNVKDFGAVGDGETDDTAAINRAISYYSKSDNSIRCGQDCGSTTTLGALVYFPPGIYSVSTPLVMYYYTQMVGDPNSKPTIKGAFNFSGIALVDSDLYIPGGNGAEWYINQSNFYRQIRNFVFDMTSMNWTNIEGDQQYVPTGVHWQVGQATSITNCDFNMAVSIAGQSATAVGIFMENGSGGFVSDLTFTGGNIGFRAGSQQFTANNLQFTSCLTAISMIWNWGFTWKNVYVLSCYIALDLTAYSGTDGQGTGSVSVVDSHFNGVPYAITLSGHDPEPDIILDNLLVENSASVVLVSGGETILPGSTGALYFNSWGMGPQYLSFDGSGSRKTGFINPAPNKPTSLLDSSTGRYFTRSKPQYENSSPIIATAHGISNNGTGDQTAAINSLLSSNIGSVVFFPAGIYLAEGTIKVPVGSIITGSGWSQIVAVGAYFYNQTSPKVLVQVGNEGDSGIVEISDMLFTVKGPTAGCILMEWNVHESTQGSSGMWDSHFRVGGAVGSDLQLADCPTGATSANTKCMAASMMLHVTKSASGYFENIWAWVADHDLDDPANADATESNDGIPENVKTDISVYGARGILVESNGPTWFYGTASEHSVLYQYQCSNASNIFFGHMQTETPYYQPNPTALDPYTIGGSQWESDPTFADCADDDCKTAWSLRLINSKNIFIYSAGFYSFFQNNQLGCASTETCQLRMIDTNFVSGLWLYNIFTKGNIQIISPEGGPSYVLFNDTTKNGYTSEIAAWLVLSTSGSDLGNNGSLVGGESDGSGFVFLDPTIWSQQKPTVQCSPPCTLILPPVTLSTTTTITFPLYTTSLEVGWTTTTAYVTSDVTASVKGSSTVDVTITSTITISYYTSITETTVLTIPPLIGTTIPVWNVPINSTVTNTTIFPFSSILPPTFIITDDPNPLKSSGVTHPVNTRTIIPPPFPYSSSKGTRDPHFPSITFIHGPPKPTCLAGCGHKCLIFCSVPCLLDCGDSGGNDFPDSNDPDKPNDPESSSECETATSSDCQTHCTATPSTCTSTCSSVVGCDVTGTNVASTITTAPIYSFSDENWGSLTDNTSQLESVAVGVISYLNSLGDMSGIGSPTTKQTSTSSSPSVPSNTAELCVGLMTTPSTEEPIYNYVTFNAGDPCDGVFILNATIGTPENICDIPNKQATVDLCAGTGTFENEGPQFFSNPSCGFALSLNGHTYETAQTVSADDSRCSGSCPDLLASVQGILLFSELPGCD